MLFDIIMVDNDGKEHGLSVPEVTNIFENYGIFHAKILFKGTLRDCLSYPNTFNSLLPEWLELPALEQDNICEGTVLRPEKWTLLPCNSRVILKNKNSLWEEKKDKKGSQQTESQGLSEEEQKIIDAIDSFITENRLTNVLSKYSEQEWKNFVNTLKTFREDALEDFSEDEPNLFLKYQGLCQKS